MCTCSGKGDGGGGGAGGGGGGGRMERENSERAELWRRRKVEKNERCVDFHSAYLHDVDLFPPFCQWAN